jgi:sulfatase maturation enzyme AslB (radical SAM superfamily)
MEEGTLTHGAPRLPIESLDAILTSNCNLHCSYCYQDARSARKMSAATLRTCVDLLLASEREEVQLVFYGGEPLLEFPLIREAVAYAEAAKSQRKRVRYGIVTNGTLLGPEVAAFLDRHRFETRLSFDGVSASQNLRAAGTFPFLNRLLSRLRTDHPRFFQEDLTVNVTVSSRNLLHLASSVDYFLDAGVRSILLGISVTHDDGWRRDTIEDLDVQFAGVFQACLRHYWRTGDVPLVALRKAAAERPRDPVGLSLCGVGGGAKVAVAPLGRAFGCVMLVDSYQTFPSPVGRRIPRLALGKIANPRFEDRYRRYPDAARSIRVFDDRHLKHSSYGHCVRCAYAGSCTVCPASIGHLPGNRDPHRVPDQACAFNLVTLRYRALFPSPSLAESFLTGNPVLPRELVELREFVLSRSNCRERRPS